MSFYSGYSFFIALFLLLLPAVAIGYFEYSLKGYRILLTVFFVWAVYRAHPVQLLYLGIYAAGSVYIVKIYGYLRSRFGRNRYIYGHAVLLALLPLIICKISGEFGKSWFSFLGISYICFRVLQVIIEQYDGVIKEIHEIRFLEFILFFPSLSSGPIDRSRRFEKDDITIYSRAEYMELAARGFYKLFLGLFYKIVCSAYCYQILNTYFAERYRPLYVIGYAYLYGLYLFFDFAGYSAMAVGTSYILGIQMPDNFNKPFLSIDMKDFWSRWHITLSSWFRDFVFTRFILDSARTRRFKNRLTGAAVGLFLNMVIMGVWHGLESHYIAYGIYHGILMAATEVYQKKSKFYMKNRQCGWYRCISWFFTMNLVMLGFLIFSGHVSAVWGAFIRKL